MRAFLIVTLCTGLAYAKPQYNYPSPSVPSGRYGTPSAGATFQSGSTFSQTGTTVTTSGGTYTQTGTGYGGAGVGTGVTTAAAVVTQPFSGNQGIPARQLAATVAPSFQLDVGGGLGGGGLGGGGTLIQKHIYVHVAPPEPEEVRQRTAISAGQATKHYKIIFIKAPSYETYQQQILQQQAQNEEKTLVYVLVKKPDDQPDITIPTAAPTAPSKPEVYFIRYKARSEVTGGGGIGGGAIGGGAGAAAGSQLSGGGAGIGGGASALSLSSSSSSSSSSQFNTASSLSLTTGDSSSSVSVARPQSSYGPPGQSGPY